MNKRIDHYHDMDTGGKVVRLFRYAALAAVALIVVAANIVLFRQIDVQLQRSYTAETDSTPWVLSQVEVEMLRYINALSEARETKGDAEALENLRLQYDLLYSRANLLERHKRLSELPFRHSADWAALNGEGGLIRRALPFMDGPDAELYANVPTMLADAKQIVKALRGELVESMLSSLRLVEGQRADLRSSLQVFSTVSLGLLGVMAALMITIYLQSRARERHRQELAQAVFNLRTTIDSSLEAAVILDHEGRVIGCNRAGAEMFSWEEGGRVIRYLSDVVGEAKRGARGLEDLAAACAGDAKTGQGRIMLSGSRVDGTSFPLELSLAQARSAVGMPIAIAFLRDISERVEREETLRQARNAALQGEEAKSRFLAMMSHEMRTPLNGLLSAVHLLQASTRLDPKQDRLAGIIENCGRSTLEQVNNVLELTRLQAAEGHTYPETEFSTLGLLDEVMAQFEADARKRGNVINVAFTGISAPRLIGQRQLLMRVLTNLVSNAVKFTENGTITLAIDAQAGREAGTCAVRISVSDTGVGIAETDRDRIFRAFETLDGSYARVQEGSGLGLGLAKLAAEAMGGRITVTSRQGEGSTFALFLNLRMAEPEEADSRDATARKGRLRPLSILVVEDNEVNRQLLAEVLRMGGHKIAEAANGAESVDQATATRFDAILMDVSMPVMDGLEATRRIRTSGESMTVPIIGVTANADPERRVTFLEAGMTEVLSKPVDIRGLENTLLTYLPEAAANGAMAPQGVPARLRLVSGGASEPVVAPAEIAAEPAAPAPVAPPQKPQSVPETPTDLPPLLDDEMLSDLEEALGANYMAKMATRFVAETDAALVAMQACASGGDLPGAAQVAHKNAGAAASLGLKALHRLFVVYERQAKAGDGNSADQTKVLIERINQDTVSLLRERGLTA